MWQHRARNADRGHMSPIPLTRLGAAAALAPILLLALSGHARAQDGDPRVVEARAHFERGEQHYASSQYALAAQEFQLSHELLRAANHQNAGMVLFNVGRSLQELGGHDAEAREAYAGFLAEAPVNAETQEMIRTAQGHMRELDARLAGSGGQGASAAPPPSRSSGGISPIGPILLGVGGAALISGLVMVGVAYGQDQDHIGACPERIGCDEALRSDVDATRGLAIAGDVVWIAGAAIAAIGLVLTFVLQEGASNAEASLDLQGSPEGAYASLRWRLP